MLWTEWKPNYFEHLIKIRSISQGEIGYKVGIRLEWEDQLVWWELHILLK